MKTFLVYLSVCGIEIKPLFTRGYGANQVTYEVLEKIGEIFNDVEIINVQEIET